MHLAEPSWVLIGLFPLEKQGSQEHSGLTPCDRHRRSCASSLSQGYLCVVGTGDWPRAGSAGEGGGQIGHGAEVHSNHMHEIITV